MTTEQDPLLLFGTTFGISSLAGLAALLRSGQPLSWRIVVSAILNSGLFGLGIALLWCEFYGGDKHPWFMMGVSLMAGLGGSTLLDVTMQAIQKGLAIWAQNAITQGPQQLYPPSALQPQNQPPQSQEQS